MKLHFYWNDYKYFPYEHSLAQREIEVLFGREVSRHQHGLSVNISDNWLSRANRTTYFREVIAESGKSLIPIQALLEASANGQLKESPSAYSKSPSLRRQSTRYSAHGLHEYRGKFNPQIVRAIGNILALKSGAWILDPFCGSGTTLLEATHNAWNAVGLDINPLGVAITQAKIAAAHIDPEELTAQSEKVIQGLGKRARGLQFDTAFTAKQMRRVGEKGWEDCLPCLDYLRSWFTDSVLVQLAAILTEIACVNSTDLQLIFRIMLSDILREVSLQDPGDLRIRLRKFPSENAPAIPLFLNVLTAQTKTILNSRRVLPNSTGRQVALCGDIRNSISMIQKFNAGYRLDAAITSPPYVTALPYIDTQRLSLVALGLVDAAKLRILEKTLIGNREINRRERQELERAIESNADHLPKICLRLCQRLKLAFNESSDGFRRQNMPALTYQYCRDMSRMFHSVHQVVKGGAPFVLVVGRNKTRLGDQEFIIDTPKLLTSLAEQQGWEPQESVELDTYHRFDVHQVNSIRSETMLILKAKPHAD
jgi:site-specific DNA-methyltransferase (cytosine-N4-specific)